jgi:predicted MPP superfamily phosphohydrolase
LRNSYDSALSRQVFSNVERQEKSDIIFFTGDLVNNTADELNDYFDVFNKVKAPLGVYSALGNEINSTTLRSWAMNK